MEEYNENKMIMVTQSSMPKFDEYIEEIRTLWDSAWLTNMGVYHQRLERELIQYLGVENISLFVNGHMALELLIQAMGLTGEVITTPFTFASTTHAIIRNGLTPVFCDINEDNYTIDTEKIETLITDKTTAILAVHVYGNVCNIAELDHLAKKYDLKVIYDAAHAFGVSVNGKGIGTFGDASMFSFHATKVFHTIEGGGVSFQDKNLGEKLYSLKNFGIKSEVVVDGIGANAKMNEFQAAMGICNLRHIDEEIEKRRIVAERYQNILSGTEGLKFVPEAEGVKLNYAYCPILFDEKKFGYTRNEVYLKLKRQHINARKYFYPLTNMFHCFHGRFDVDQTPIANYVSKHILTLPLYANLQLDDVDRICKIILDN